MQKTSKRRTINTGDCKITIPTTNNNIEEPVLTPRCGESIKYQIEDLMKRYHVKRERVICEYPLLKYVFLESKTNE